MPSLDEIADRQWRDYQAHRPGQHFAEPHPPLALEDAYAVQRLVRDRRAAGGDAVIGYKVGCTGPGTTAQFGMKGPVSGYLWRSELRENGAVLQAGQFDHLAIEGEMGLRFASDGTLAATFPIIELHNFVFRGNSKTLPELVANNAIHAGVVLPPPEWQTSATYLSRPAVLTVTVNGAVRGEGELWPLPGGPMASVGWLRDHLEAFGEALQPDGLVIAGTALGLYPVAPGDHIMVSLDGAAVTECRVVS